jgi:hypothetical protein
MKQEMTLPAGSTLRPDIVALTLFFYRRTVALIVVYKPFDKAPMICSCSKGYPKRNAGEGSHNAAQDYCFRSRRNRGGCPGIGGVFRVRARHPVRE